MGPQVLIVDDDEAFRSRAAAMLCGCGYRVVGEAGSVAQARDAIGRARPEAVLLDISLPDGDGASFARELCSGNHGIRVLLTSSDADAASRRLVQRCGATGFIAKVDLAATDLAPFLGA
jgi:DNA-binding NarL/FixJ family response regulator